MWGAVRIFLISRFYTTCPLLPLFGGAWLITRASFVSGILKVCLVDFLGLWRELGCVELLGPFPRPSSLARVFSLSGLLALGFIWCGHVLVLLVLMVVP